MTELGQEENSWQLGKEGKMIRGRDTCLVPGTDDVIHMGVLEATLHHTPGLLTVDLHQARAIAGQRSPSSYAQVFLIEDTNQRVWREEQRVVFEVGHTKTKVFKKNINPEFNEQFNFKMEDALLTKKSLVIALWDKTSSGKDSFLAGVTLPLKDLARFSHLGERVDIGLTYQAPDGYPERLTDKETEMVFGGFRVGWDLKECNDRLVAYIDRARVLKQAYEVKDGLPDKLHDRTSVVVTESNNFLSQQIAKLRLQVEEARRRRGLAEQRRQEAKEEGEAGERRYRAQVAGCRGRQEELDRLALEEAGLRCRECSGSSLRDYYRAAVKVPRRCSYKPPAVAAEELALEALQLNSVSLGAPRQVEMEEVAVRVRSEFHTKFINNLEEARRKYKKQSHIEISIEEDIMKIYQVLIFQRADINGVSYSLEGLRMLERDRCYQPRVEELLEDIRQLSRRTEEGLAGGQGTRRDWDREMLAINAALDAALARLREVMGQISIYQVTEDKHLDEVALYQQLLDFEKWRLTAPNTQHRAAVTEHSSRRLNSVSAAGNARRRRDSSADSGCGYSKAATPDGTLEGRNSGFLKNLETEVL